MQSKKIWIVLCEGNSDRIFLQTYHDDSVQSNIKIEIYSGDFLTDNNNHINEQNVINEIQKKYSLIINKLKSSHVKASDIEKVIYMTDTDDCFRNNTMKSRLIKKLICKDILKVQKREIPFEVLLMGIDLEEVCFDYNHIEQGDLSSEKKIKMIYVFTDEKDSKDKIDEYFVSNNKYPFGTYDEFKSAPELICNGKTNLNTIYT